MSRSHPLANQLTESKSTYESSFSQYCRNRHDQARTAADSSLHAADLGSLGTTGPLHADDRHYYLNHRR